jgi:hypothetical protein
MINFQDDGKFDKPVTVTLPSGNVQVATTREAAELLLYKWPIGETGKRIQARMACMRVLGGSSPPGIARRAFLDAANEARILVGEQHG